MGANFRVSRTSTAPSPRPESTAGAFRVSSNSPVPVVPLVFPVTALAAGDLREAVDQFDAVQVLRLLVAQLPLDACAQRRTVFHRQRLAIELVREDGLLVEGVVQV